MTKKEALNMLIDAEAHTVAHYGVKAMRPDDHEGKRACQSISFAMGLLVVEAVREKIAELTGKTEKEVLNEAVEVCRA